MSLIRKILLAGTISLGALIGCDPAGEISDKYVKDAQSIQFRLADNVTTIETKITDIQEGAVPYCSTSGYEGYGKTRMFKYIEVKGGDVERLVLIYPYPEYFQKFVPAKIKYRALPTGKISSKDFVDKYIGTERNNANDLFTIKADGIIEPDGIEYIGEK